MLRFQMPCDRELSCRKGFVVCGLTPPGVLLIPGLCRFQVAVGRERGEGRGETGKGQDVLGHRRDRGLCRCPKGKGTPSRSKVLSESFQIFLVLFVVFLIYRRLREEERKSYKGGNQGGIYNSKEINIAAAQPLDNKHP